MTHLDQSEFYPHGFLTGAPRELAPSVVVKMGDGGLGEVKGHVSNQIEVSLRK